MSVTPEARRNARTILDRLRRRYPTVRTALHFASPWQLLVATVLSAQTTDDTVNRVVPVLFERWPSPHELAVADPEEVEAVVHPTGFFRQKTRAVIELSADLVERFGGMVPADLERLVSLKGVGRKTASVVLTEAFGLPAIAVDTHVGRVTRRLGLTGEGDPAKVEAALRELYPESAWSGISMRFIQFGRDTCDARKPRCYDCVLRDRCAFPDKRMSPDAPPVMSRSGAGEG
ncbi:MAG: endonuclease III [Acidimicrobiia bacterium]|nr:endonuclease III [Acidimicrobiia bacterium]